MSADLFPAARGKRLVAVMPHPDDEAYSVAGTLALAARSGAEVTLVTATRGESGWLRKGFDAGGRSLAEVRTAELERSCRALGIGAPHVLGWPDGHIDEVGTDAHMRTLRALLDELDPHVVLTLGRDGVYGHRDHLAVTGACLRASNSRRVLLAEFPRGLFSDLTRTFLRHKPELLGADTAPDSLGIDPDAADLTVDIGPVAEVKRQAIASHASQLERTEPLEFLLPGLVEAVIRAEWYSHAAGPRVPAGAGDPFAGLDG